MMVVPQGGLVNMVTLILMFTADSIELCKMLQIRLTGMSPYDGCRVLSCFLVNLDDVLFEACAAFILV